MHLVHTYIAYRVSNICSVYRSGLLYVPDRHSYLCVRYAHQSANAVSCRGGVYSYMFWVEYSCCVSVHSSSLWYILYVLLRASDIWIRRSCEIFCERSFMSVGPAADPAAGRSDDGPRPSSLSAWPSTRNLRRYRSLFLPALLSPENMRGSRGCKMSSSMSGE